MGNCANPKCTRKGHPYWKPFIKWVGGKTALLGKILPLLPTKINTYYEPMVGGGAVFISLFRTNRFSKAIISDINSDLINTYNVVKHSLDELLSELHNISENYSKLKDKDKEKYYYGLRDTEYVTQPKPKQAARFIALNKLGYNGLYRVNKQGKFNVPFGKRYNAYILDVNTLSIFHVALQKTKIICSSYEDTIKDAQKDDAVYLDPPYIPLQTNSFTAYSSVGFNLEDQIQLRDLAWGLKSRGVPIVLSNSDTPTTRELYKKFSIKTVEVARRVGATASSRKKVNEVVIL
jgi:DNA adenine methylase